MTVIQFPKNRAAKKVVAAVDPVDIAEDREVPQEIERDRWKRPLILQPDGSKIAYLRASSIAEVIGTEFGLALYYQRLLAQGLAQRPDLLQQVHLADKGLETHKELDEIIEQAKQAAGIDIASNNGSMMHKLTDHIDKGGDVPKGLPDHITAMLDKYAEATVGRFTWLDSEEFVVVDSIQVAGTYDRRAFDKVTGLRMIGDLKTAAKGLKYYTVKTPAQIACYAAGKKYDADGGRTPIDVSTDVGFVIHLPWVERAADAECTIRRVDLRMGRAAVRHALKTREIRKWKEAQTLPVWA